MKRSWIFGLILVFSLPLVTGLGQELSSRKRIPLKLLVTGREDGDRREEFRSFLSEYFTKVGVASYSDFEPQMADEYDVVIFDCEVRPRPGAIGLAKPPKLPRSFNRASMMIAGAGALICDRSLNLKIDWL